MLKIFGRIRRDIDPHRNEITELKMRGVARKTGKKSKLENLFAAVFLLQRALLPAAHSLSPATKFLKVLSESNFMQSSYFELVLLSKQK